MNQIQNSEATRRLASSYSKSTPNHKSPIMPSRRKKVSSSQNPGENSDQLDGRTNRFGRLFTEEDEFNLLECYFKIMRSAKPTNKNSQSQPTLDSPTLDRIENETNLGHKFSQTQIVDKLRRLRLKYHKLARTKSLIKTPHDREIYEIGRQIWGKGSSSKNHSGDILITDSAKNEKPGTSGEVRVSEKQEVDLKNFPVLVNEFSRRFPGNVVWLEGLRSMEERSLMGMNEKWILLHIEEAEMMARRAKLVQKQAKAALENADHSEGVNH